MEVNMDETSPLWLFAAPAVMPPCNIHRTLGHRACACVCVVATPPCGNRAWRGAHRAHAGGRGGHAATDAPAPAQRRQGETQIYPTRA